MYLFPCVRKTVTLQSFMKQAIDSVPNEVTCEHSFLQKIMDPKTLILYLLVLPGNPGQVLGKLMPPGNCIIFFF